MPSNRYSLGMPILLPLMLPVNIASKFGTGRLTEVLSLESYPAIASNIIAPSRTVLVIGPA